jgi:hypothetical protein
MVGLLLGAAIPADAEAGSAGRYVGDLQLSDLPPEPRPAAAPGDLDNTGAYVNTSTLSANVTSNTGAITNAATGTWNGDIDLGANTATGRISNAGAWSGDWNNSGGTLDNSGHVTGDVANASGTFTNEGTVGASLANGAAATNSGKIGGLVSNSGDFVNNAAGAIAGGLANTGTATNNGLIVGGVNQSGVFTNNTGAMIEGGLTNAGGTSVNNGSIAGGATISAGGMTNNAKVEGAVTLDGASAKLVNNGAIDGAVGNQAASASFVNNATGVVGGAGTSAGTTTNSGEMLGGVANSNIFTNDSTGVIAGGLANGAGTATNNGAVTGGAAVTGGTLVNNGQLAGATAVSGAGALANNGAILGTITNSGNFVNNSAGVVTGALTNSGKTVNGGALQGGVQNSGSFTNNALGVVAGGLSNTAGSTANAGAIQGGAVVTGGELANSGSIAGGLDNSATVKSTGTISGVIIDKGELLVGDGPATSGAKLKILPGSTVTGPLTVPVDLGAGKANFVSAAGASVGGASVVLSGALANPDKTYWGALAYSDTPIALSATSAAALAALSNPLYAYTDPTGEGIVQTINPGLAATAASHASAILTTMNTSFFGDPSYFLRAPVDPTPNLVAGSVWSRGVGAEMVISGASSAGAVGSFNASRLDTHLAGAEFGAEAGLFNIENSGMSLHFGVTGGEAFASTSDRDLAAATGNTRAPFVGGYAALAGNGFFGVLQARHSWFDMALTNASLEVVDQQQSAEGMTYSAEAGYHLGAAGGVFVEPSAGLYLSRFRIGSEATNVGVLSFGALRSELGRLTLRTGTSLTVGPVELEPYLAGSLWREWQGATTVSIPGGPTLAQAGIGGFEEASLGVSSSIAKLGLTTYAQLDYRIGDLVRGWGVTGGARYNF